MESMMTTEKKEEKKSFEEMWADVKKNSGDFNAWTSLLTHVEQNVLFIGIQKARDAFLSFFEHHPYGSQWYWKKFADLERENLEDGEELAMKKCQEIFEEGLKALPLSIDLWLWYIKFTKSKLKDRDDDVEQLRALYKRAVDVAGAEFRSDRLWDSWISWETDQQQLVNVTAIYDRLISNPTCLYTEHFEKFQGLLEKYPIHAMLDEEEIEGLKQLYEQRKEEGSTQEDESSFIKGEAIQRRKNVYKENEEACAIRHVSDERMAHLQQNLPELGGDLGLSFSPTTEVMPPPPPPNLTTSARNPPPRRPVVAIVRPFRVRRSGLQASSEISVRPNRSASSNKRYKQLFEQAEAARVAAEGARVAAERARDAALDSLARADSQICDLKMSLWMLYRLMVPPTVPAVHAPANVDGRHPQAYGQPPPPPTAYAPQPTAYVAFRGTRPPPAYWQQFPPPRNYGAPPQRSLRR